MKFPKREQLKRQFDIANSALNTESDLIEEDGFDRELSVDVTEESKVYNWVRVYLNDENNTLKKGDVVKLTYNETGESCNLIFASYNKSHVNKDVDGDILADYNPDEDTKVLCLMVDIKSIEKDKSIPLLRTLFRGSKWYSFNLIKRTDLVVTHNDEVLEYYSIDF